MLVLGAVTAWVAVAVVAEPVSAHPFGTPPTASVTRQGSAVIVDWAAGPDDIYSLGEHLGLLPEGTAEAFLEAATQVAPSAADEEALARSSELAAYLVGNISAEQDGRACQGSVAPVGDVVSDGARVVLRCPEPVTSVDVSITMLTDVHPAYRTFAAGRDSDPPQAVYTLDRQTQAWRFGTGGDGGDPAADGGARSPLPAVAAVAALLVVGGLALVLRRR